MKTMSVKNSRTSGFTFPPHPFQILSWFLYLLFVVTFYTLFLLFPSTDGQIASGLLFTVFAIITCASNISATTTNPADPRIYQPLKHSPRDAVPHHLYCYRCERHVLESSKHCTVCQKCIDVFDHHCIWLNNCVGKHNYLQFLVLLFSAAFMLIIPISIGIAILVKYATDSTELDDHIRGYYPSLSGTAYFILTIIISILAIIGVGAIIQLLAFHVSLIYHNMTTYEFIMSRVQGWRDTSSPSSPNSRSIAASPERKGSGSAFSAALNDIRAKRSGKSDTVQTSSSSVSLSSSTTNTNTTTGEPNNHTNNDKINHIPYGQPVSNPTIDTASSSDYIPQPQHPTMIVTTTELPATESSSSSMDNKLSVHSSSAMDERSVRVATASSPTSPYRSLSSTNNGPNISVSSSRSTSPSAHHPTTAIELITHMNTNRKQQSTPSPTAPSPVTSSQFTRTSNTSSPNASEGAEDGPSSAKNEDEHPHSSLSSSSIIPGQRSLRSSMVDVEVVTALSSAPNGTVSSLPTTVPQNNEVVVNIPVSTVTVAESKETVMDDEEEETKNKNNETNEYINISVPISNTNTASNTDTVSSTGESVPNESMVDTNATSSSTATTVLCSPAIVANQDTNNSSSSGWEPSPIPRGTRIAPLTSEISSETEGKESYSKRESERKEE